jgi:Ca-activated chloride channel family protein
MRFATVTIPICFLLAAAPAVAGDSSKRPEIAIDNSGQAAKGASIHVDVSMALAPVNVVDPDGRSVTGLRRENFRLLEGKQPRDIASFSREDQPISVGLIFDCSRSMANKFMVAREAPVQLYKQLNDRDETFLVTVSDAPAVRSGITSAFGEIRDALLFTTPTGSTSLLDGVYMGLAQMRRANNPRKALIVVSDGGDNNSRYTLRELKKIAMESDTQIYSIGLHASPQTSEEEDGPVLLEDLARASGGIHYALQSPSEIAGAMAKIGMTLHNQYVLGYYPPSNGQSGKYRPIKVELRVPSGLPPLRIFARAGYYTPEH